MPSGIHLVGSVAMPDAESVFRALTTELAPWLRRIPDGETGERHRWIYWQREMLLNHPDMELDLEAAPLALYQWDGELIRETELIRFRPGVEPSAVVFETGYGPAAVESYATFRRLRDDGVIPDGVRFQVCLPTPMASGFMYVSPNALEDYLPVYERALIAALETILAAVPHDDLSLQWDICQEVLVFEDYFPSRPDDYRQQIFDELVRLGSQVPADVELGYHLCYGTLGGWPRWQPENLSGAVTMANAFAAHSGRRVDWIHIPVLDRSDDGYFAPLADLEPRGARIYLGAVHNMERFGERIATARKYLADFGVGAYCGFGRIPRQELAQVLRHHVQALEM